MFRRYPGLIMMFQYFDERLVGSWPGETIVPDTFWAGRNLWTHCYDEGCSIQIKADETGKGRYDFIGSCPLTDLVQFVPRCAFLLIAGFCK